MPLEIEKKFLLSSLPEDLMTHGVSIIQGYLVSEKGKVVRVRIYGENAFLTLKSKTVNGVRSEYEYEIPLDHAREMLDLFCKQNRIEKTRYKIEYKGFTWEIDRFSGANAGLVVAEIELTDVDQPFEKPGWVGKEVSRDPKYFNSNLIHCPYSKWDF